MMSERYRYVVDVTYTAIVWADDADEAEQYAIQDIDARGGWPVSTVACYRDYKEPQNQ
jgi:hypothetical protein